MVNNLWNRGRQLGPDVFERIAAEMPVDLAGMNGGRHQHWLADVRLSELYRLLPTTGCSSTRSATPPWGSRPEAMALGMPVLELATTEMATAVRNGVNGYVETDVERLVAHARRLVLDRDEAAELSGRRQAGGEGAVRHRALRR